MNKFIDNKKYDDINNNINDDINDDIDDVDDDLPLCNCNLCWISRQLMSILPNNIIFRNPFVLFIILFILPSVFFTIFIIFIIILYQMFYTL